MSYILDALKKSEAERSRGVVPTLLSPQQTGFRSSILAWVLIGALLANAALVFAWMYWPRAQSDAATTRTSPEPMPASDGSEPAEIGSGSRTANATTVA